MSIALEIGGFVAMFAGFIAIIYGASAWAAHCVWVVRFRGGMARDIRNSVKLGWNTGVPEDGQWVLVREHMPKHGPCTEVIGDCDTSRWAVMQRRGNMLWTQTGGYGMPITNLTGWLAVEVDV